MGLRSAIFFLVLSLLVSCTTDSDSRKPNVANESSQIQSTQDTLISKKKDEEAILRQNPKRVDGKAPAGMVLIPGGVLNMGGDNDQADEDEYPKHEVEIPSFFMDLHEVTNAQFAQFVEATGYQTVAEKDIDWEEMKKQLPPDVPKPPDSLLKAGSLVFHSTDQPVPLDNPGRWWQWTIEANWQQPKGPGSDLKGLDQHPVVHIAWEDAVAFAEWAGKRLPTEAEWEWAARGGQKDLIYPWGNDDVNDNPQLANYWQGMFPYENKEYDGFYETAPVKSFPPNPYGLYDMAGNVWEWCTDWYRHDYYGTTRQDEALPINPRGPNNSFDPYEPTIPKRVIRGGSFLCNDSYCSGYRVARRMKASPDSGFNHTGFRCVKDVN